MPDLPRLARPVLRFRPSVLEAAEFMAAYDQAEADGEYGLRASMGDQLFVREQLELAGAGVEPEARAAFEARADRLIELAFWGGIAVALGYLDRSDRDIEEMLARMQEWNT
jgi:hypothetical protein